MTSYSETLQRGDTIGCYQIEEVLGRGGFAVTYLAVDLNLDVHVAIKEYLPREIIHRDEHLNVLARRPEFVEDYNIGLNNFAREAKTLARFKHLNIVRVHQVIHKFNTAYMVMDYEHGRELAEVLEEHTTLPEDQLREILFPILDGVEEIHGNGLAHRDIKPSNIYLRDNGSPVLLDFGAARYTMSETTQQLTAVVTVGYTPIEQYNVSANDQGPWSDIYALAAVLYEAVTGEMPVDSVTRASSSLTNASDPLAPVANKAQQHYSNEFLNAIDHGLKMEAEDRPQGIAQWRDAFNGVIQPAEAYKQQQPIRPARKSKLKTRAHNFGELEAAPAAVPQAHTYESDPRLSEGPDPRLSVDVRTTRFDPNFDSDFDDVEIVPLSLEGNPRPGSGQHAHSEPVHDSTAATNGHGEWADTAAAVESEPQPLPASPFASNPAPRAPATNRNSNHNSLNDTLINLADTDHPTHTQELRKVLRRDIVRRDTPAAHQEASVRPPPQQHREFSPDGRPNSKENEPRYHEAYPPRKFNSPEQRTPPPLPQIERDEYEFDESDWDYEAPPRPSKLKWIAPLLGLTAIVGGALLFVNNPELFKLPTASGPDMTVDTALAKASEKISNNQLIFPAGESALDYYQLILASEPDNSEALGGVASIQEEIKNQIIKNVDNDNLTQANKLLSRANEANLQIEGRIATGTGSEPTVAIDQVSSPWVAQQIADVEAFLDAGDADGAETLLKDVDKYIANVKLSDSLHSRIEAIRENTDNAPQDTIAAEGNNTIITPVIDQPIIEEPDSPAASTLETSPEAIATPLIATPLIEATRQEPASEPSVVATLEFPEAEQKIALTEEPATLPSAPRRSFIEGNDSTARHLNQLRQAIESKNLQRVLQVSDALPEERKEFLRKLFQRYDRLDVTIDNIESNGGQATAKLSVSMFNQRSDGSYYSAGKWNDVRLATDRNDSQWQPIQW